MTRNKDFAGHPGTRGRSDRTTSLPDAGTRQNRPGGQPNQMNMRIHTSDPG
jgi:hypothetical protein